MPREGWQYFSKTTLGVATKQVYTQNKNTYSHSTKLSRTNIQRHTKAGPGLPCARVQIKREVARWLHRRDRSYRLLGGDRFAAAVFRSAQYCRARSRLAQGCYRRRGCRSHSSPYAGPSGQNKRETHERGVVDLTRWVAVVVVVVGGDGAVSYTHLTLPTKA